MISEERNILVELEAHIETGIMVETLSAQTMKKLKKIVIQCRPFSNKWKSLKCLPLRELESALAA